jgi:hypothetical protein
MIIAGPVKVNRHVSTTGADSDLVVVDVYPMTYTDRLGDAGIAPSVGGVRLCTRRIRNRLVEDRGHSPAPWRHLETAEFATLEWVYSFNTRRSSN